MKRQGLEIVDPIHRFILLDDNERRIIDTPIYQRLRKIRQLAGAHLTYPSALHTRFEHSLGVAHLAGQSASSLKEKGYLNEKQVDEIRAAALLHDIGHGPFSHLFEEVLQRKKKTSHEEIGKKLVLSTEIGDILDKSTVNKKSVASLAFGRTSISFMNELISGVLSADIMDYLPRDGYFSGAEHAKIDYNRIINSLEVYRNRLALDGSALYSFESMMISRYQMFKAVYFHKSVRAAEVMLIEAMALADDELGFSNVSLDEYAQLHDENVLAMLCAIKPSSSSRKKDLNMAKRLADDYQKRRLLKCVFEKIVTDRQKKFDMNASEIQEEISRVSNTKKEKIFVDFSQTPSIPLSPEKEHSQSIILVSQYRKDGRQKLRGHRLPLSEIPLVSSIFGFMNMLRVYTTVEERKKVEMASQKVLGGK